MKLSFKQYYESKINLKKVTEETVTFRTSHDVYKYCKVPFLLENNKTYIAFKPKDVIVVEWHRTGDQITPVQFTINDVDYIPSWNTTKTRDWVQTSTLQIFNDLLSTDTDK
jgi:hypothetical protein